MSTQAMQTEVPGELALYNNTNSGALYPYSETEMLGKWQFDAVDPDVVIRMGVPVERRFPIKVTRNDVVLAQGSLQPYVTTKPTKSGHPAPTLRGSLMVLDGGEILSLVAWKKQYTNAAGITQNYLQVREDNRQGTGRCFV